MFLENKKGKSLILQKSSKKVMHFSDAAVYWYRVIERRDVYYAGRQRVYVQVV